MGGEGVPQDFTEAVKWWQLAAEQGHESALECLRTVQQDPCNIPTPPSGTTVTTVLMTSAASVKYNNRSGKVVTPTEGTVIKPGRVAVLLDGEQHALAFNLKNLRIH